jgi:hypothetical protein
MYIDGQIIFCADGILRIYFGSPLLAVKDVQDHEAALYEKNKNEKTNKQGFSDYKFWSKWWHSEVVFEKGLTLGKFLQCLEPWGDFFADLTGKDVPGYINESKKLILKDNQYENAYIALFAETEFSADKSYPEDDLSDSENAHENFLNMLNHGKKSFYNGNWTWWSKYMLTLYYQGESDHYSVSTSPLNKFAHLPLYLDNNQYMYEFDALRSSVDKQSVLINESVHGVQKAYSHRSDEPICFLMGKKTHTTREVIEGFFNFFATNPQTRDYRNDEMQAIVDNYEENQDSSTLPQKEENHNKTNVSLVLIKDGEPTPELPVNHTNTTTEDSEVVFNENAYDDLFNFWDQQIFYWQDVIDSIAKKPQVILKLNYNQPEARPELRMFGLIVDKINYEVSAKEDEDLDTQDYPDDVVDDNDDFKV